jgi:hypothetical protein
MIIEQAREEWWLAQEFPKRPVFARANIDPSANASPSESKDTGCSSALVSDTALTKSFILQPRRMKPAPSNVRTADASVFVAAALRVTLTGQSQRRRAAR